MKLKCLLLSMILLSACGGAVDKSTDNKVSKLPPATLAIFDVNVVDVATGSLLEDRDLLIDGERIVFVGEVRETDLSDDVEIIEGQGLFAVPGFWDMHVHLISPGTAEIWGPVMIAHGITYVRDLWADCPSEEACDGSLNLEDMRDLQARVDRGTVLGPQIVGLASFLVGGKDVSYNDRQYPRDPSFIAPMTEEEGAQLARFLQERGVDFVKTYNSIPREAYFGLLAEANDIGLEVSGHVPRSVLLTEAIKAGHRTLEHARDIPMACSAAEAPFTEAHVEWSVLDHIAAPLALAADPSLRTKLNIYSYYRQAIETQSDERCTEVFSTFAKAGAYWVPTHTTRRVEAILPDRPFANDNRAKLIPDQELSYWEEEAAYYTELFEEKPSYADDLMDFHLLGVSLTGPANDGGVRMMVGTDLGDTLVYPGSSFHEEMELMVRGGMSEADLLRAATLNAAEYEGIQDEHGLIDDGYVANITLLKNNPLENIKHTTTIAGVVHRGVYRNEEELAALVTRSEQMTAELNAKRRARTDE